MNFFKVLLILLLPFVIDLVVGCCDCAEPVVHNYVNCELFVANVDNSGPEPMITEASRIKKEAFGVNIQVLRKLDHCYNSRPVSIFSSVYAMNCHCPIEDLYSPVNSIVSIKIITVNELDEEHPAGADVTGFFRVVDYTRYYPYKLSSVPEYVENMNTGFVDFSDPTLKVDVLLMKAPQNAGKHGFVVKIDMSDGTELIKSSPSVDLI